MYMDVLAPPPTPKKFPVGVIVAIVVVVISVIIGFILWQSSQTPTTASLTIGVDTVSTPSPMPPQPSPMPQVPPAPQPSLSSPTVSTSPLVQQPAQQPAQQPQPATSCPEGYLPNNPTAPGFNMSTIAGIGTSYCYKELSRPDFSSYWPTCPAGSTQFQIDALNENCYVPATSA